MKALPVILLAALLLFTSGCDSDVISDPTGSITSIPKMNIYVDHDSYVRLLNNRFTNLEVPCTIEYGGRIRKALLEPAGSGSRYFARWSYKVELTEGEPIEGLTKFNLNGQVYDPTMMHTELALYMYRSAGFPVFESRHVLVTINNRETALMLLMERVEKSFFAKREMEVSELFKAGFESKFTFNEMNNPQFQFEKKIPDDGNFNSLIDFIHVLDTCDVRRLFSTLGPSLDIRNYIRYHAITSILNNDDAFTNNFFLLRKQPQSPFEIIPWDFDKCFRRGIDVGFAGENEIIRKILKNFSGFDLYKQELEYQLNNVYTEENLFPIIDSLASEIKDAYNLDPYLGNGRYVFDHEINFLKNYITQRRTYLLNNLDSFNGFD